VTPPDPTVTLINRVRLALSVAKMSREEIFAQFVGEFTRQEVYLAYVAALLLKGWDDE